MTSFKEEMFYFFTHPALYKTAYDKNVKLHLIMALS